MVNGLSAWAILNDFVPLKSGDNVFITCSNAAVGQAIAQLGKAKGVKVTPITSAQLDSGDFGGKAALAVTDSASSIKKLVKGLAPHGAIVSLPSSNSDSFSVSVSDLIFGRVSVNGFDLSSWVATSDRANVQKALDEVSSLVQSKSLVVNSKSFELSEYANAVASASNGETVAFTNK